jgi:hypothetical protein
LPAERFVYPIFKNASSSLAELSIKKIYNSSIGKHTNNIEVYWREAHNRFNSGANTYLQHNNQLDVKTLVTLIECGELVNRHFMPQYMWLCHLYKHYTGTIIIKDVNSLDIAIHKNKSKCTDNFIAPTHWIDLDNLIYNKFINKTTVLKEINSYIQSKSRVLYNKCIAQD